MRNFISGDIEAGGVGQVVDVEGVFEGIPLLEGEDFDQRDIGPLLRRLAEDIALAGGEGSFVGVAGGNGATQIAGVQEGA